MNNENARRIMAEWFAWHDALKHYTNDFSETLTGKTVDWFLDGPRIDAVWIRNAETARAWLKPKHKQEIAAGIEYGRAYAELQQKALNQIIPISNKAYELGAAISFEIRSTESRGK